MTTYVNQLIITVVVCQIATMISPDGENSRRYVRIVCALVTILTIISPITTIAESADDIAGNIRDFFTSAETESVDSERGTLEAAAYAIMSYARENFDLDLTDAELTFYTDDSGNITELQMFVKSGVAADRDRLAAELEDELGVTVHIFMERRLDDE